MDKPKILYKYKPIDKFLKASIKDSYLWFSQREALNDPSDLSYKPDGGYRKTMCLMLDNMLAYIHKKAEGLEVPEGIDINKALDELTTLVNNSVANNIEEVNQRFPFSVCCFTEKDDNGPMWAHYADQNTGVCLIYDLGEDYSIGNKVCYVTYRKEPFVDNGTPESFITILLSKGSDWAYEKEWRILHLVPGEVKIKKECLKGIIFGYKTKEEQIQEIIAICNESGYKDLEFYMMEQNVGSRDLLKCRLPF